MNKGVGMYIQLGSIMSKVSKKSFRYPQVVYKDFIKLINEYITQCPYLLTLETDLKNAQIQNNNLWITKNFVPCRD